MHYKTVFEVTDKGFEMMTFIPLVFVIVGVGISWFNLKYNKSKSTKRKTTIIFGFIFAGIGFLFSVLTIPTTISNRNKIQEKYKNKDYLVVEGVISNFHPMPKGGHDQESFTVNGVDFEYSDFEIVYAFNNTASHGGPIKKNGQQVRLAYLKTKSGNRILKVELKQ